jgi:multidrug efflux pump subunit AcrA (membrane-fusion protein)
MPWIGHQTRRRWAIVLIVLVGVLAVTLAVWWRQQAKDVSVTQPTRARITESIASSGRVRGVTETLVGVQAAGVVERLFVREGDRVAAGQRLAILKNDVAEARVAQADAALTTAQATLIQVARGALPSELEAAAAQVQQARAQLDQQRASLAQAEQAVVQAKAQLALHQAERDLAVRHLARAERLLERGLIARAEHDEAITRARVVEQQVAARNRPSPCPRPRCARCAEESRPPTPMSGSRRRGCGLSRSEPVRRTSQSRAGVCRKPSGRWLSRAGRPWRPSWSPPSAAW